MGEELLPSTAGIEAAAAELTDALAALEAAYPERWRGSAAEAYGRAVGDRGLELRAQQQRLAELRSGYVLARVAAEAELTGGGA